jgi:hypothetical protein
MKDLLIIVFSLVLSMYIMYYLVNYFTSSQYSIIEGMTNAPTASSYANNIGAAAVTYANNIKAATTNNLDAMLVSKYKKDYETTLINMDDYVSTLMMQQVQSMNLSNPDQSKNIENLTKLANLQQAKTALNTVMTFVDKQK